MNENGHKVLRPAERITGTKVVPVDAPPVPLSPIERGLLRTILRKWMDAVRR